MFKIRGKELRLILILGLMIFISIIGIDDVLADNAKEEVKFLVGGSNEHGDTSKIIEKINKDLSNIQKNTIFIINELEKREKKTGESK